MNHNRFTSRGFEVFQELEKCDKEIRSEQMLESCVDHLFDARLPQTLNLLKKKHKKPL